MLAWAAGASALELGRPFGDHMVLPMRRPVTVWGTGDPGGEVTVGFSGQTVGTRVDKAGRWELQLEPLAASTNASWLDA